MKQNQTFNTNLNPGLRKHNPFAATQSFNPGQGWQQSYPLDQQHFSQFNDPQILYEPTLRSYQNELFDEQLSSPSITLKTKKRKTSVSPYKRLGQKDRSLTPNKRATPSRPKVSQTQSKKDTVQKRQPLKTKKIPQQQLRTQSNFRQEDDYPRNELYQPETHFAQSSNRQRSDSSQERPHTDMNQLRSFSAKLGSKIDQIHNQISALSVVQSSSVTRTLCHETTQTNIINDCCGELKLKIYRLQCQLQGVRRQKSSQKVAQTKHIPVDQTIMQVQLREKEELLTQLTCKLQASVQFINQLTKQCELLQAKNNEQEFQHLPSFNTSAVAVSSDPALEKEIATLKKKVQLEQEKFSSEIKKRDSQLTALTQDLLKAKAAKPTKSAENNVAVSKEQQSTIGKLTLQINQLTKESDKLPELLKKISDQEASLQSKDQRIRSLVEDLTAARSGSSTSQQQLAALLQQKENKLESLNSELLKMQQDATLEEVNLKKVINQSYQSQESHKLQISQLQREMENQVAMIKDEHDIILASKDNQIDRIHQQLEQSQEQYKTLVKQQQSESQSENIQINKLNAQIAELGVEKEKFTDEIRQTGLKLHSSESSVAQLNLKIKQMTQNFHKEKENQELEEQLNQSKLEETESTIESLQKSGADKELTINKLNQSLQTKERSIQDLQTQIHIISSARDDTNALKQMQASYINQIEKLEGQVSSVKAQYGKEKLDQKHLSDQMIKDLKQDVEELKHKQRADINIVKSQADHDVQKGLANMLKIEGQLKQTQSEKQQLQEEIASLKKQFQGEYEQGHQHLRDQDAKLASTYKSLSTAQDQNQQKDKMIQEVTNQMQQAMSQQQQQSQTKIQQLQKEKSGLEQKIVLMEAESKSQIDQLTQTCMEEISSLETKLAQLEIESQTNSVSKDQQTESLKNATKTHQQEKSALLAQMQQLGDQIVKLQGELQVSKKDQQEKIKSQQSQEGVLQLMLSKLQESSSEKDIQLAQLKKQLQSGQMDQQKLMVEFQQQCLALTKQNQELQSQIANHNVSQGTSQNQIEDDVKKQLQSLVVKEAEIESLRKQVKKYKDQVTELEEQSKTKQQQRRQTMSEQDIQIKDMMISQLQEQAKVITVENEKLKKEQNNARETINKLSQQLAVIMMGGPQK